MPNGQAVPLCDPQVSSNAPLSEVERGSIIVVVATDAPFTADQLKRIARRVTLGLGRMGSIEGNGSGRHLHCLSTANAGADNGNSTSPERAPVSSVQRLTGSHIDVLFSATVQATEEAITNAMIAAKTMTGADYLRSYAIPHQQLQTVLWNHNRLREQHVQ